ncbi:MAG: DUF1801 domain-containing protein [Planctomycetia bacterium]|nr:DUF1801 domain-containing protein [Planctomycetia bacterium]
MAKQTKPPAKDREARRPTKAKPAAKAPAARTSSAKGAAAKGTAAKAGGRPTTVAAYLASLPEDRRAAVSAVRDAVNRALPAGYEEGIAYGMIGWHVPHRLYPAGYHCDPKQPLPFAGLASQKGHMSLHLMAVYLDPPRRDAFVRAWKQTGKKLDMGAACVRFKAVDDLALDVVTDAIAAIPVTTYVAAYDAMRSRGSKRG